jgi:hypothetical protein
MLLIRATKPIGDYCRIKRDIFTSLRLIREPNYKYSLIIILKDFNIILDLYTILGSERFVSIILIYYFSLYKDYIDLFYIY